MNDFDSCRGLSSALLLCSRRAGQEVDKVVTLDVTRRRLGHQAVRSQRNCWRAPKASWIPL